MKERNHRDTEAQRGRPEGEDAAPRKSSLCLCVSVVNEMNFNSEVDALEKKRTFLTRLGIGAWCFFWR